MVIPGTITLIFRGPLKPRTFVSCEKEKLARYWPSEDSTYLLDRLEDGTKMSQSITTRMYRRHL